MLPSEIIDRYRVSDGKGFKLSACDPCDTCDLDIEKQEAKEMLAGGVKRLKALQERLYAESRWAVLMVLQGLDTAGKDGVIEHVMSGVNPQGCEVHSFKAPSSQELDHDYLWRCVIALPARGRIGIFNRSYYEETVVVRVHPKLLAAQRLPEKLVTDGIWRERFEDIRNFELHLARNGTVPLKFFLNISKDEQARRLLSRIDEPDKRWKFRIGDLEERKLWDRYIEAYDETIRHTAAPHAPWYVVPADNKWFTRLVVAAALVRQIEELDPRFPKLEEAAFKELNAARAALVAEAKSE